MQKFSIYSGVITRFPIEERIAAIKEVGYDSVCLDFDEKQEGDLVWENQVRLAHKYGLPIENVHLSGKDMTSVWSVGERGEFVTERLIDELRRMSELGIKTGVAHVTWGYRVPEAPSTVGLQRYERAVEAAEKYGVKLAIENSVFPEQVCYLLDHIKSPHLGFCYDSGHENAFTPETDYLEKYSNRIIALHLHDNDGKEDMHAFPLTGTIDWKKKLAQLKKSKYFQQMITMECSFPHDDVVEGFAATLEAAKTIAKM